MSEIQFTRKIVDDEAEGDRTSLVHYLLTGEHGTVEMLLMKPPAETYLWQETGGWHGAGIAYHTPFPFQDDQVAREAPCEYVPGGRCFYDVTYSHPEELTRRWWGAGRDDEVIWQEAEDRYLAFFVARSLAEHGQELDRPTHDTNTGQDAWQRASERIAAALTDYETDLNAARASAKAVAAFDEQEAGQ